MKLTKLIGFVTVSVVIPSTIIVASSSALAGDVQIRTPNLEAVTDRDGSVYINTGKTSVRVPSRRRDWTPWRYWRLPWQGSNNVRERYISKCRHTSYQSTSHVNASSSQIVQSSISSNTCN